MAIKLKPLNEQVIVITGASSGIGLQTATLAAERGAKVVLGARSEAALTEIVNRIVAAGGQAAFSVCDVTQRQDVEKLAKTAIDRFGRIDTWVNDAGLGMWGRIDQSDPEECKALFNVNVFGVLHGCQVALQYLRGGGAIINLGSEVSEAVAPLQGIYSASKHAVKGLNDALRIEIEEVDKLPISITLIQPQAIDTPFPEHAKNFTDQEPKLPSPMIEATNVAEAILDAAVNPTRFKKVGPMSVIDTLLSKVSPALADKMGAKQNDRQHYDEPPRNPDGALHRPSEALNTAGQVQGFGGRQKGK